MAELLIIQQEKEKSIGLMKAHILDLKVWKLLHGNKCIDYNGIDEIDRLHRAVQANREGIGYSSYYEKKAGVGVW